MLYLVVWHKKKKKENLFWFIWKPDNHKYFFAIYQQHKKDETKLFVVF